MRLYCLVILLLATGASAAVWESIGPSGGDATQIVGDPSSPNIVYVVTRERGVYKSIDQGTSWIHSNDGLTGGETKIALSHSSPGKLYASAAFGQQVFRSVDSGQSWSLVSQFENDINVNAIVVHYTNSETVYLATDGRGILKSTDSGATWNPANNGISTLYISIVVASPTCVLAGSRNGEIYRSFDGGSSWGEFEIDPPFGPTVQAIAFFPGSDTDILAATDSDIFKSTDTGATWNNISSLSIEVLAIDQLDSDLIYAAAPGLGVARSTDGGSTWNSPNQGLFNNQVNDIVLLAGTSTVLCTTTSGVFRSNDSANSWTESNKGIKATWIHDFAISRSNPSTMYSTDVYAGLYKSTNGGDTWTNLIQNFPRAEAGSLALHPTIEEVVYATYSGEIYRTQNGGNSWELMAAINSCGISDLLIASSDPRILMTVCSNGSIWKSSTEGRSWRSVCNNCFEYLNEISESPLDQTMFFASGGPDECRPGEHSNGYRSTDLGETWTGILNGGCADIYTIAGSGLAPDIIYAGTNRTLVRSINAGTDWHVPSACVSGESIHSIVTDPRKPDSVFAGFSDGGVYKSSNFGVNWIEYGEGFPDYVNLRKIHLDPSIADGLFATTPGAGIYRLKPSANNNSESQSSNVLYEELFNDGVLNTDWTYSEGRWTEECGKLVGKPISNTSRALALEAFSGCSSCSIQFRVAEHRNKMSPSGKITFLAWYQNSENYVSLTLDLKRNRATLRQYVNGALAVRTSTKQYFIPDQSTTIELKFTGEKFQVSFDYNWRSISVEAATLPFGTIGLQTTKTTAILKEIRIVGL